MNNVHIFGRLMLLCSIYIYNFYIFTRFLYLFLKLFFCIHWESRHIFS